MNINNKKRGVSLYLIVIIMSVLLAVVFGLSTVIIGGAKIVADVSYGVIAFYAADTGIERALYNIQTIEDGTNCDNFSGTLGEGNYGYTVTIDYPSGGTCLDGGTAIYSLGEYNGTKRRIEATY
jgi:hypothetical protein